MAAQRKAKPAAQAPVSAHPLFPMIVALWFAALLGVGTMVLPQTLFDQIGVATGLGALGFTFRLGLGLAAGLIGALIGVLLARKVANGKPAAQPLKPAKPVHDDGKLARKPISAMEELGSEGLDDPIEPIEELERSHRAGAEPLAGRRRALTVTDENAPSDYMMQVPLPGGEGVLDLIGADDFPDEFSDEDTLELGHFGQEEPDTVPDYSRPSEPAQPASPLFGADPYAETDEAVTPVVAAPAPSAGDGIFRAPQAAPATTAPFHPAAPFAAPVRADEAAPPFGMPTVAEQPAPSALPFTRQPHVEPIRAPNAAPFSAPVPMAQQPAPASFSAGTPSIPMPSEADTENGSAVEVAPQAYAPVPMDHRVSAPPVHASARPVEELATLDTVALVERFTRALRAAGSSTSTSAMVAAEAAPAFAAPQPPAAPPAAPFAAPFAMPAMPAPVMTPAHPAAIPFADPAAMPFAEPNPLGATLLPAALAPLSFDEHDDNDEYDQPFSLPLNNMAKPFAPAEAPAQPHQFGTQPFSMPEPQAEAESEAEAKNEDSFGSLLAMRSGFGMPREFVRIEDQDDDGSIEPVVVFPGTAPQGGATPASDGPSRDPAQSAPFARPQLAAQPAAQPIDRNATEAALRDALARLQQMSGAA